MKAVSKGVFVLLKYFLLVQQSATAPMQESSSKQFYLHFKMLLLIKTVLNLLHQIS